MTQSRTQSLVEVCTNISIGWVVSFIMQLIVFPQYDINLSFLDHIKISVLFTVVSIARGYIIRRWFNGFERNL